MPSEYIISFTGIHFEIGELVECLGGENGQTSNHGTRQEEVDVTTRITQSAESPATPPPTIAILILMRYR